MDLEMSATDEWLGKINLLGNFRILSWTENEAVIGCARCIFVLSGRS